MCIAADALAPFRVQRFSTNSEDNDDETVNCASPGRMGGPFWIGQCTDVMSNPFGE